MITISVPAQDVADAVGPLGEDVRVVVWNPQIDDAPPPDAGQLALVCIPHGVGGRIPHGVGGRRLYQRIGALDGVRVIQIPSAGYEHAAPFVPAGVALANARGVHDSRTAEFAITLALASQRRLPAVLRAQQERRWDPIPDTPSLADRRTLVVGYGSIGAALGARLRAMEAEVIGVARSARTAPDGTTVHAMEDLYSLLPHAEIVFLVTPLTEQTTRMVGREFLAAMPDGALLVNVGRGALVDQDALLPELHSGRLRAALDVTDPEPLPADHPLWDAPGTIIAPHIGGWTPLTDRRYAALVREQVERLRAGRDPANWVMTGTAQSV